MKRMIKTAASAVLFAFLLFGCDQLQDSLSAEQEEDLLEDTGSLGISGKNWYYNGSASSNVSSDSGFLTLTSTKQIAESTGGVSVSFEISYTDKSGNSTSVTKSGSGSIASSGSAFNVDMSPVLAILDGSGSTTKDNTATAKVKVSGLVCNEGDQRGRTLSVFEKSVSVKPLFSGVTFSTASSTTGKTFAIPLNGEVSLGSDSVLVLSGTLPSGLSSGDFSASLSSDGTQILLSSAQDLYGQDFSATAVISKVYQTNSESAMTLEVPITFSPAFTTNDTIAPYKTESINYDISSVEVSSDGINLTLNVKFGDKTPPKLWENDRIVIMIDDANLGIGTTTYDSKQWSNAATYMTVNSSVEFYAYDVAKDGLGGSSMTKNYTWSYDSDTYLYTASSSTLSYTIPLSSITDGTNTATSSDTLRIVVLVSDYWWANDANETHVEDVAPATAATLSSQTSGETNDTLSVDFDSALVYSSEGGSTPAPSAPKYFTATSVTSSTVSLAWSEGLNATSYTLTRTDAEGNSTELLTESSETTYSDTGLSASTTYTYSLTAVNSSGSSSAKTLEVTTSTPVPESFTVTPTFTFNPNGTDVTVSWTESANATAYKVQYKNSTDDGYTVYAESTTEKTATLSSLAMGTYNIEVIASNDSGSLKSNAEAALYPTITLDGTMSESEYWTNTNVASASTDSYSSSNTYNNIEGVYITNDSSNVYVAVKFAQAWGGDKVNIDLLFDTQATTNATSWTGDNCWAAPATTTSYSNDGVDYTAYSYMAWVSSSDTSNMQVKNATSSSTSASWDSTVSGYQVSSTVIEYSIPLSSLGSAGGAIKLFVSDSQYAYENNADKETVLDCVPASAATISDDGVTIAVDFSKALTYTIK